MNVGFISLGCSKNLIDTEMCMGIFKQKNIQIVNNPKMADVIIINTCGFIESAKEEGINTILEMAEYKKTARCKYLIAMGCLVQRYKKELEKAIPEVDLFLTIDEYDDLWNKINSVVGFEKNNSITSQLDYMNRMITTGNKTAYLKIAEGCNNRCTYCAIPNIRGNYISRKMEDIVDEAKLLAKQGFEEIIVIAQDTSKYGIDLYGEYKLPELLRKISKLDGIKWIRFLYAYPETITDELVEEVKKNKKVVKYFDIPIQHISNGILKKMNRKSNGDTIRNTIKRIREAIPDVIIRTTFIVGFPGETEEDFLELYEFVNEAKFDKLGVFMYSKEDGTPAAKFENQVHPMTKKSRYNKIMKLQKQISKIKLEEKIGNEYETLIESYAAKDLCIGRTYMDVPEEDGVVFIKVKQEDLIGKFIKCIVTDVSDYDLVGEIVE